jgi:ABC-type transport system substrate-binding protein
VSRIDPPTNRVVDTITVGSRPGGIVDAAGSIWVANTGDSTITRIDPASDEAAKPLPIAATELAYGAGSVIPTGNGPTALAVDRRGVWVSNQFDGKLALIDPRTDGARRIDVGNQPQGLAVAGGNILVGVDTQSAAAHRGGTLRMRANLGPDSIDPAVAYSGTSYWLMSLTTDGLVHGGGPFGAQVPDLAVSIPTPTDGGKTYTFHLRRGIRYSNGKPLRAADFRYGIERFFKIGPFPYFGGIVGATRCAASPKRCDLSRGIVTNDSSRTVTFHLVAPDPGFLDKLAVNFAVPMPVGTPARRGTTRPLPTTGPYTIESYRPKHSLTLKRNPFFHEWSRAAQPDGYVDRIVFDVGGTADDAVADVVGGRADLFSSVLSSDRLSRARLARLAIHDASQLHTFPMTDTAFLFLNTRVPPFDRLDARRAVNYAVDRAAVVEILGGPKVAEPTCQIIPPNFPGYRPYCPYTAGDPAAGKWTAPDLVKARALIARSGTSRTAWPSARRRRTT